MNRTQPELTVTMRKVDDLLPYALNNKKHPEAQVSALAGFIREVGFRVPLAIDADGSIIAGHGRLLAAQRLGLKEVPCIVHADLSERERRAMRIADNRLAELAETDSGNLASELNALLAEGYNLDLIGFNSDDMKALEKAVDALDKPKAGHLKTSVSDWKDAETFFEMPEWLAPIWDKTENVIVQYSGGKDSTASALWAAKHKGHRNLTLLFVDPGVEFPGISSHIREFAMFLGAEYVVEKPRRGLDWWSWIAEKGWPSIIHRTCADKFIHATFASFVREFNPDTSILLTGSRAEEAVMGSTKTERSELSSLGKDASKYQHFAPCFAVKKEVENQIIADSGAPLWDGYARGFVRTACWCCPGQCGKQAAALKREYPGLANDIRRWEQKLGQKLQWTSDRSFDDIANAGDRKLEREARVGGSNGDDSNAVGGE